MSTSTFLTVQFTTDRGEVCESRLRVTVDANRDVRTGERIRVHHAKSDPWPQPGEIISYAISARGTPFIETASRSPSSTGTLPALAAERVKYAGEPPEAADALEHPALSRRKGRAIDVVTPPSAPSKHDRVHALWP